MATPMFEFATLSRSQSDLYHTLVNSPQQSVLREGQSYEVPSSLITHALRWYRVRLRANGIVEPEVDTWLLQMCAFMTTKENWQMFKAWCRFIAGGQEFEAEHLFLSISEEMPELHYANYDLLGRLLGMNWQSLNEWGLPKELPFDPEAVKFYGSA